jgi:hypothetical protein
MSNTQNDKIDNDTNNNLLGEINKEMDIQQTICLIKTNQREFQDALNIVDDGKQNIPCKIKRSQTYCAPKNVIKLSRQTPINPETYTFPETSTLFYYMAEAPNIMKPVPSSS